MSTSEGPAAPESGFDEIPTFEELAADPEIAALLDFEPVPRKTSQPNAWTPDLQREFIARLASHGSITRACTEVAKERSGVQKLYNSPAGASFRAAWHAAIDLAKRRQAEQMPDGPPPMRRLPTIDRRLKANPQPLVGEGGEGQILNEFGEWEDEGSYMQRGEDARDGIAAKLLRIRRLYLQEISASPGKRAAFEILTELPIDWEAAERLEPQADEPFRTRNQRPPDMILMAESGWSFGECGYGPDKKAERRRAIDEHRAAEGLDPVDWEGEEE